MSVGACCDKLQVHSKEKEAFSHSKYVGDFLFQETPEGDPVICNEAAVFKHTNGKLFLYRNKDGGVVGNNKKGIYLRSQDPDRSSFIQECPCQVRGHLVTINTLGNIESIADKILAETGEGIQQMAE